MKNHLTAGFLALFLGGIGAHKFYLGKNAIGFIYLLFCWTGIPAVVSFIEAIIYFLWDGNDVEFTEAYANIKED